MKIHPLAAVFVWAAIAIACGRKEEPAQTTTAGRVPDQPAAETSDQALVRVVQAIPEAPPADVWTGDEKGFAELTFGEVTPYKPVSDETFVLALKPAGDAGYQLVAKATGKCIVPLGNDAVSGAPLVQAACIDGEATQHWRVSRTDYGFTVHTGDGQLVVGVGYQRFGGARTLVLQTPQEARHQSWTSLPE